MMKIQLPIATGSLVPPVRKQSCQVINAVIAPFTLGEKLTSRRTRAFQLVGPHEVKKVLSHYVWLRNTT